MPLPGAGVGWSGDLQRVTHLLAAAVQWLVVPVVVASRVALWKWPRLRAVLRGCRG
ncbi:MAG TPA: hypothetical protein VGP04_14310 [Pseudonocardiaceae bacterium]|nr:hypothetical protein [Pseudonocardiaceae bacterium]